MIFSGEKILDLVHAVIPNELSVELSSEIERDVLSEVGNIILNDCMGVFTRHLGVDLDPGVPVVDRAPASQLLEGSSLNLPHSQILVTEIIFALQSRQIQGYPGLLLDLGASDRLIGFVDRYIESMEMST